MRKIGHPNSSSFFQLLFRRPGIILPGFFVAILLVVQPLAPAMALADSEHGSERSAEVRQDSPDHGSDKQTSEQDNKADKPANDKPVDSGNSDNSDKSAPVVDAPDSGQAQPDKNNSKPDKGPAATTSALTTDPNSPATSQPTKTILPKMDSTSGGLTYNYPIAVPPGIPSATPSLALNYNSQKIDNTSVIGLWWEPSIPDIVGRNTHGIDQLYTRDEYTSSEDGDLVLTQTSGSVLTFYPESQDASFSQYQLDKSTNTWKLSTKSGTVLTFGDTTASREDDAANLSHIYRWMLSTLVDANGNTITYTYTKDQGRIYPANIHYAIFDISFVTESVPVASTNLSYGFSVAIQKRIKEIDVKTNSQLSKSYVLNFSSDALTSRSLLSAISPSGISGSNTTTLPSTVFSYSGNNTTTPWIYSSNFTIPTDTTIRLDIYGGTVFVDVNGDGLTDILSSWNGPNDTINQSAYLQNANGTWTLSAAYQPPAGYTFAGYSPSLVNNNVFFLDLNGDGLVDMFNTHYSYSVPVNTIYLNTGNGWAAGYALPAVGLSWNGVTTVAFADFNGDGLVDIYASAYSTGYPESSHGNELFLNNGDGTWTDAIATLGWPVPPVVSTTPMSRFVDLNGDGITDIINLKQAWIGDGKGGFTPSAGYTFPSTAFYLCSTCVPYDDNQGITIFDVNNDGLPDMMQHMDVSPTRTSNGLHNVTYLNTGSGWVQNNNYNIHPNLSDGHTPTNTKVFEINSDGVPDIFYSGSSYLSNSNKVDMLTSITFPFGGRADIAYKPAGQYKDNSGNLLNPKLPYVIQTVNTITTTDPVNNVFGTDSYSYGDGTFYFNASNPFTRKFAGFGTVIKADDNSYLTKTYFYKDDYWKFGKAYRVEYCDNNSIFYAVTMNQWDSVDLGSGRKFVKLSQTLNQTYDSQASHRDTATTYVYDNTNGNLLTQTNFGEVAGTSSGTFTDIGTDESVTSYTYATQSSSNKFQVSDENTVDQLGAKVREARYYYDALALGLLTNGNQTKVENWKSGTAYINSQKTYNSMGLVTSATDPRGKVTLYTYDPYSLYPAKVTDPLSHATNFTFDYPSGQVASKTDANGSVWSTTFDGFGRILQENIPDPAGSGSSVAKTTYAYVDTPSAVSVHKTDYLDSLNSAETYQYFDGLGRLIQERKEAEIAGNFNVRDLIYNKRGLLWQESLSYTGSGVGRTSATSNSNLYTIYLYDPIRRVSSVINAVGTTSFAYNLWQTTVTDANGKSKSFYKDAYGNLARVDEINSGATFITTYNWNLNNKLASVTDASGNVRSFSYDGLGRRLTAQDLHAPADTTFGTWTYTYDDAGNMTQSVSPLAQTVNYVYDAVNRATSEDYTGTTGTDVSYTYDSCLKGIGRLCSSTFAGGAGNSYTYDAVGNIASDQETINSNVYLTSYTFDRQGNTLTITSPDNAVVRYTFNTAGLLEKIDRKESSGSLTDVVSNFDYSPLDQVATQVYSNGAVTTNTYDAANLYRLTNKTTTVGATTPQNLTYTYDSVGNITKIVDASSTASAKTANYVYDDLYRLVTANITFVPTGQTQYKHVFTYDPVGNILTGPAGSYLYQGNTGTLKANPHAATSINGATYAYDANGNLTGNGTMTNTWNYRNQLTQSVVGTTTSTDYYDAAGNRARYQVGTANTYYPNKYYNTNGTKQTKQIFAGKQLVATVETVGTTVTPYYNFVDQLGSVTAATDATGAISETLDYYPFGSQRISSGSYTGQRQYIGQIFDASTSLDYLNTRFYKSDVGRFISQDPVFWEIGQTKDGMSALSNPQSLNSYSYANNNPIGSSDPEGRMVVVDDAIAFGVGGVIGAGIEAMVSLSMNEKITWAKETGAFVGGGISGVAIANAPETLGLSLTLLNGGISGGMSNLAEQRIAVLNGDQKAFSRKELGLSIPIGMGLSVIDKFIPDLKIPGLSSGPSNWISKDKELLTKIASGQIKNRPTMSFVRSVVGSQLRESVKNIIETKIDHGLNARFKDKN